MTCTEKYVKKILMLSCISAPKYNFEVKSIYYDIKIRKCQHLMYYRAVKKK